MDPRNHWVTEPSTPSRLAEAAARSILAEVVYIVALYAALAWAGATVEWFAGLGLLAPLLWLFAQVLPNEECEQY